MAVSIPIRKIQTNGAAAPPRPRGRAGAPATVIPLRAVTPLHGGEGEGYIGPQKHVETAATGFALPDSADAAFRASLARMTGGLSPATLILSYMDWWLHLASEPERQLHLLVDAADKAARFGTYSACRTAWREFKPCIKAEDTDDRFDDDSWEDLPFSLYAQAFLLAQDWWQQATTGIEGVSGHHEDVARFSTRQWLDMIAPTNFPWSNPKVIRKAAETGGMNFVKGVRNFLEDMSRLYNDELPRGTDNFKVGKDVAVTEGKVVYRNRLIELIQYAPQTGQVHAEPVLIVPAWIMKYYVLDLSPQNSLVRYLVENGHTVFMISWKNPGKDDANLGLDDYLHLGIRDALDAISAIVPDEQIHATGYCVGGTLLTIAAAYMARIRDDRLKTLTLFTTQVDFEEAGELLLFVDESELAYLEDLMRKQGYLKKEQVSGAFNMLRSKDLVWSHMVEQYLMGEDMAMFDLMAWNADATRLPYRMHSEYLRSLYLNNDLAQHRYTVEGDLVSLRDIKTPIFAVATRKDHIAPWKSAYKINALTHTEVTFLLTSGGHNAGVVSEPGRRNRAWQMSTRQAGDPYILPETWRETVPEEEGSWWPVWQAWLADHSRGMAGPPHAGAPRKGYPVLGDAPGTYVYEL